MKPNSYGGRLSSLIGHDRHTVRNILLYAIFSGLISLSLPLGIQAIINFIQLGEITSSWVILTLIVVAGSLFSGWIDILQLRAIENLQLKIFTNSAFMISSALPRIDTKIIGKYNLMELANRFFDTISIQKSFQKLFRDLPISIVQIFFGFILLSAYHPFFVFLSVVILLSIWFLSKLLFQRGLATSLEESKHKYKTAHWMEEISRVVRTFKMSGSELHLQKTDHYVFDYLKSRSEHFRVIISHTKLMIGFKAFIILSLLALGGFLVIQGEINIGQFVAAEVVIILLVNSIEKLVSSFETGYDLLTSINKLSYLFDLPREDDTGKPFTEIPQGMKIEARNLTIIDHEYDYKMSMNFNIDPGERIVLTGEEKAIKFHLGKVLVGFEKPQDGELYFNDINVNNINLELFRRYTGDFVSEEDIFTAKLIENVTLGREIDQEWLKVVLHVTEVDRIANRIEQGFDTVLYSGTNVLTDLEIAKIMIARSLVHKPELIVYEHAMKTFDEEYKKKIVDFVTDKKNRWTVVAITEDDYFMSKCDREINLKDVGVKHG